MAVKRYDGSAWQTVAGLGAQGAAATSSSIATWVKTASGGETSLSGNDDNSQSLSYTVGQELVFINGTLLKRGSDYTATNGTSITGLTALAANDVATVWTVNAFSVTGAIANTIVDAKGDLLVGTAADTPGRLAVGTNGQALLADSTTGTGLRWGSGGKISQVVVSNLLSTVTTTSTSFVDSGLSVTITPSSTTSTILIHATVPLGMASAAAGVFLTLANGAGTNLLNPTSAGSRTPSYTRFEGADQYSMRSTSIVFQHSPASTSAQTYKVQFKVTGSTGCINRMGTDANAADYSQGIATIVAYEVLA
jgi:hypothetical protein